MVWVKRIAAALAGLLVLGLDGRFVVTMRLLMARAKRDGVDMRMPRDHEAMDVWEGLAAP